MTEISGADILLQSIIQEGVRLVFGYPGGSVIPLYDRLVKYPKLRHILVRHEQAAAFAANGVGRATGKPGVCFATSGPGATNLVTGVADAMLDSIPMIAVTGQVHSHLLGSDAFQETDSIGIFLPVVKHSYFVSDPKDLARVIKEAFYIAQNGRPGPVHIDITKDAFLKTAKYEYPKKVSLPGFPKIHSVSSSDLEKARDLIQASKKPVAIVGHGVVISRAFQELKSFLEKSDIPAVCTLHGLSALPSAHSKNLGLLGMHGNVYANYAVHNSDLVISLGSRFDDRITGRLKDFAPDAKVIHFEIDPSEIEKNVRVTVPLIGDISETLKKLNPLLKQKKCESWWKVIDTWKDKFAIEKVHACEDRKCLNTLRACDALSILAEETKGNVLFVPDVGQHQMWAAQVFPVKKENSHFYSGGLGAMGFSLPTAMGIQLAMPDEEVWSVSGDGGFQMNSQELITLIQDKIPLKMMIINNHYLGMVRQWQELFHDKTYSFVDMKTPDFVKLAEANEIPGFRANNQKETREAIKKARKIKGPVLIECNVSQEENVFPMVAAGDSLGETRIQ
ncbi:biosynthetic-type acetolactate synthase large subunit [Candidatus Peregrinibacteria bacterium]|nr:biosynthetic-type acetolactate synthase large subunit [Candidatus Peregrinibacteria bacterium]